MRREKGDDIEGEPERDHAAPVGPPTALEEEVAHPFLDDGGAYQGDQARTDATDLGGHR